MEIYKDMLEKLKYHKQLLMNAFIRNNYYPSDEEITAALSQVNARLSLFESYISKPGSYFNPTEINYCFEMLYKDIEILYKVLQSILLNEYSRLKLHIESTLTELESKADTYLKRCEQEANSSTLGTTIVFQSNSWNIDTVDQTTIINLGTHNFIEGSSIACFADINNVDRKSIVFKFITEDSTKNLLALPSNIGDNIIYTIPGKLGINKYELKIGSSSIINDNIQIEQEINQLNKYKLTAAKNYMTVTYKKSGTVDLVEFPDINNYNFLATQDCFIEFYIVDGNVNENSYMEYSFNMAPNHCNFSLQDGRIKLDSDIKRIHIDAQKGLLVSFLKEHGDCYAECNDAIIVDNHTILYNGNKSVRDIIVREYVRTNIIPYNVYVYIDSIENIINDIETIYIKEV